MHPCLNPTGTPESLQNKVIMDVCFYFIRREIKNVHTFRKDTFKVETDANTNLQYKIKTSDERSKNHRDDTDQIITAHIPELQSEFCPVKSFLKFISKLNPRSNNLWQYPKDISKVQDADIWYPVVDLGGAIGAMAPPGHDFALLANPKSDHQILHYLT